MSPTRTILLVDDDQRLLRSLQRRFADFDFEVLTAISPAEAMVFLKRHNVDVIVSDNQMTGTNGTRFLASVRKQYPDILRFMMTGDISKKDSWLVEHEIGICGFFEKPFEPEVLIQAIENQLTNAKSTD